jgi:hypothetical protein
MSATAVPSLVSLSAAAGMVSALAYWAADVKRRIANDPARNDYLSQTWFDEPRIYPQRILEDLPPGGKWPFFVEAAQGVRDVTF